MRPECREGPGPSVGAHRVSGRWGPRAAPATQRSARGDGAAPGPMPPLGKAVAPAPLRWAPTASPGSTAKPGAGLELTSQVPLWVCERVCEHSHLRPGTRRLPTAPAHPPVRGPRPPLPPASQPPSLPQAPLLSRSRHPGSPAPVGGLLCAGPGEAPRRRQGPRPPREDSGRGSKGAGVWASQGRASSRQRCRG